MLAPSLLCASFSYPYVAPSFLAHPPFNCACPLISTLHLIPTNVHTLLAVMRAFPTYVHALHAVMHALPSFVRALIGLVVAFIHPCSNSFHHSPRPFFLCLHLGNYSEDGVYKREVLHVSTSFPSVALGLRIPLWAFCLRLLKHFRIFLLQYWISSLTTIVAHIGVQVVVTDWLETNGNPKEPNKILATMVYIHQCPNRGIFVPISNTKGH